MVFGSILEPNSEPATKGDILEIKILVKSLQNEVLRLLKEKEYERARERERRWSY
jgi:hypothetical protein